MHRTIPSVVTLVTLVGASGAGAQATLTGLGFLSPFAPSSSAAGISGDGLVAVGDSGPPVAYRWTSGIGMTGLGTLPGLFHSNAIAASFDGGVIAGSYTFSSGESRSFRWTTGGGMAEITGFPTGTGGHGALGVSDDGLVIAGTYLDSVGFRHAYHHTAAMGVTPIPPLSAAFVETRTTGISRDGTNVVGYAANDVGNFEAFRYTIGAAAPVGLGDLSGGTFRSEAYGANTAGDVIVGMSESTSGLEAFRWAPGGMTGLGDLPGGLFDSRALAVSADGSVIVGYGNGALGYRAMYWTAATGMVDLHGYLSSLGATGLAGWELFEASGVSADGMTITGSGIDPTGAAQSWIATVPGPGVGSIIAGALLLAARRRRAC